MMERSDPRAGLAAIAAEVGAPPASDGVHRLGWWLARSADPAKAARGVCAAAGVTTGWLERVVAGQIVEISAEVRRQIAFATRHAVMPSDWDRPGAAEWTRMPLPRVGQEVA